MKGQINIMGNNIPVNVLDKYITIYTSGFSTAYLSTGGKGSVLRQVLNYLKKNGVIYFDKLWLRTESYAGGNSMTCYVIGEDEKSKDIMKSIIRMFEYGKFNPMIDLYEYDTDKLELHLDTGMKVEISTKYNFLYSNPPYDVKQYEVA